MLEQCIKAKQKKILFRLDDVFDYNRNELTFAPTTTTFITNMQTQRNVHIAFVTQKTSLCYELNRLWRECGTFVTNGISAVFFCVRFCCSRQNVESYTWYNSHNMISTFSMKLHTPSTFFCRLIFINFFFVVFHTIPLN